MALLFKNSLKLCLSRQFLQLQQKNLTTSSIFNTQKQNSSTASQEKTTVKKKGKEGIKITLFINENMTVTALEEAKNLAKRRSMHLVKVQDMDTKTQRPVYKLLTPAEMLEEELAELKKADKGDKSAAGNQKKSDKTLSISARIGDHDLQSRLKNISKWLNKQHEVRILIQGSSEQDLVNCEKIFKSIEELIKSEQVSGKIVQKRTKDRKFLNSFTLHTAMLRCYSKLYKQHNAEDERFLSSLASNSTISNTYMGPLALTGLGLFFITIKYLFWWDYLKRKNINAQGDDRFNREESGIN